MVHPVNQNVHVAPGVREKNDVLEPMSLVGSGDTDRGGVNPSLISAPPTNVCPGLRNLTQGTLIDQGERVLPQNFGNESISLTRSQNRFASLGNVSRDIAQAIFTGSIGGIGLIIGELLW